MSACFTAMGAFINVVWVEADLVLTLRETKNVGLSPRFHCIMNLC